MNVYFDNAATTKIDPVVLEEMLPFLKENYGNPSAIHSLGRKTRSAIEKSRKLVADILGVSPSEIFFTSSGTESDNMAIRCAVETLGIEKIITSKVEHHAVLRIIKMLETNGIKVYYLPVDEEGNFDYQDLEKELESDGQKTLVSIMHANNEIGNLCSLERVGKICKNFNAYFHSDTVQSIGHYDLDFHSLPLDFASGSAHKFHGPKGIGLLYVNHKSKIHPLLFGGSQERNMRAGTENVCGIVGQAKALEISYENMYPKRNHIQKLKNLMISQLKEKIPQIAFNGNYSDSENNLYTVLNVSFPPSDNNEVLLFNLDINGICCSGGSACSSGSEKESHVMAAIGHDADRTPIRFSFSKYNTPDEVQYTVDKLVEILDISCAENEKN